MDNKKKFQKEINAINELAYKLQRISIDLHDIRVKIETAKEKKCIWIIDSNGDYTLGCHREIKREIIRQGEYCRDCGGRIEIKKAVSPINLPKK